MTTSPTQRALAELRKRGYTAAVVEHWNPHAGIRQDLFGFIDVIGLKDGETLAVQATTRSNISSRVQKIGDAPLVGAVREAGWRIVVWGWARMASGRYELREVDVS